MGMRDRARAALGLGELEARLDRQRVLLDEHGRELARIAPQVAALEARMEDLRQLLDARPATGPVPEDAAAVWDEIRREHEQVRARISAATRFEERLRRLEDRADG